MDRPSSPFLSRTEFAELAAISLSTVDRALRDKKLPVARFGKRILIHRSALDALTAAALAAPEGGQK